MTLLVLGIYLACVLAIGLFSHHFFRGTGEDYFVATRTIGPFVLLMSLFGTHMTSFSLLGASAEAYRSGFGVFPLMASSSALVVPAVFFFLGTRLWAIGKRHAFLTQVQFFRARFESKGLGLLLFVVLVALVVPYLLIGVLGGGLYGFMEAWKRSVAVQIFMDRLALRVPVFGDLIRKSTIARWTRTLSTMFAAGVPLVEALESVGGASGNHVYMTATRQIQAEVSTGTALTVAMQNSNVFPSMVLQMCSIGEETGALDAMLSKVADFYEQEVDDAVEGLSSLMEPMIMVVLGTLIGGMVIAMYLPIFKLGQAI